MTRTTQRLPIVLRPLGELRDHEETKPARLNFVKDRIVRERSVDIPIIVDKKTGVIIDGHHRAKALRILGMRKAPVVEVDYLSDEVTLTVRPESPLQGLTKEDVLAKGLSDEVFPHKTTKHYFAFDKADFPPTSLEDLK